MIMKANKQIGFIYKDNESIDRILKDGDVVFERGFLREKTSTTLPINFGGVGKNLKDYKIYGNTYQNSTRGVNLFNHYLYPVSRTYNGVSITNNEDGSFTLNGTCTSNNTAFAIGSDTTIQQYANEGRVTQTAYYISGTCTKGSSSNARTTIRLNYDTGYDRMIPLQNLSTQGIISKTHPQDSRETGWSWRIVLDAGDTFDNFTIKYQLEKGNVATDYEPYTGGQPSPNPDYPQEIISCGDRTKNLFDISTVTSVDNGSISDNLITSSSFTSGSVQNVRPRFSTPFPYKTGTYYISADVRLKSGTGNLNKINDGFTDYTKVNFPNLTNEFQRYVVSHEYNSDTSYSDGRLLFQVASNSNELVLEIKNIMISTSNDYNYTPYGYKIPVNINNTITNIYLDEPLRKIDGYSDYIDFINGKVVRRIKETLLDDNITWTTGRFAIEKRIYTLSSNIDSNMRAVTSNSQVGYLLSNQYKAEKLENILALSVRNGIGISSTSYFSILNQDYASATDFLQALHDNPIVLDYVLRTPTEETITLPNIPTVDENNTLNIETEITPSQVYIKYKSNE